MTPRPCTWPDGGCGKMIVDVVTVAGRKQVLDVQTAKRIVLVHAEDDLILADQIAMDRSAVKARVVTTFQDHHSTCAAWARKVERERRERAAGQATKAGER